MSFKIFLLDVDGVLIHAKGYRESIRATIQYITERMGQAHLVLPDETDMRAFEAENIIFEWDSAPLCIAALLHQVPHLLQATLAESLASIAQSGVKLEQPDYQALARAIPRTNHAEIKPSRAALGTLFPEHPVFVELLGNAHSIESPITQLFQHFVLGSEQYARSYHKTPHLETTSRLESEDVPMLSREGHALLFGSDTHLPVIYTARPSLPPTFTMEWSGFSPEAEYARRLLGIDDTPLLGYGRMQWLAQQAGAPVNSFVKPSPCHGLAAIFSAVLQAQGDPDWEERGLRLALADDPLPPEMLDQAWEVYVFEDSGASIQGVRQAAEKIAQQHEVTFTGVGIASDPVKSEALRKVADHVAPDINAGLRWALLERA